MSLQPYTSVDELRRSLDDSPMSRAQIVVVVLAVLMAVLDGYDMSAMSFVAPVVSKAWAIDKSTLGMLLGSSLFGMAGGALLLSPLADTFGRRPMVLTGVSLVTLGTLLSTMSDVVWQLAASRGVTGLGIGVMVALTTSVSAEFANKRRRSLAVACTTVGFAIGGVVGALLSAGILKANPWQWVFGFGAAAGCALLALASVWLLESPVFLIDRRPANALDRINRVLARMGRSPLAALPPQAKQPRASYRALFAPGLAATTIRSALVYLLVVTASYYLLSWLPQLVVDAGFPPSSASMAMAAAQMVGIAGGMLFGTLASRIGPVRLASIAMVGFGLALAGLGYVPANLTLLMVAASTCGFFLSASTAVFYASLAEGFPPLSRVSGIGFVMGFGRLCSGVGPWAAGAMFAAGFGRGSVSLMFASGAIVAGLLVAVPLLFPQRGRDGAGEAQALGAEAPRHASK
ncbi:MAG: MFS transporter [Pseudomonadota bacterium]